MEEWKTYKIGEICESVSDTYRGKALDVVLVNTSDVYDGVCLNHTFVPNKNLKGQFKKTFKRNDILYSEIRPANRRFAFIDFEPENYIASTKLMVIRCSELVRPRYLYHYLKRQEMLDELQALAESRSGTFPQITFSELALFEINLPNLATQDKIVAAIDCFDDKIALNNRINHNLEEQAQALYKSWFVDFEPFRDGKFVDSELGLIPDGWRVATLGEVTSEMRDKVGPRQDVRVLSPVTTGQLVLSEEFFTKQVFSESISKYLIVRPNDFAYNPARVNIGSLGKNEFDFDGCVSPVYVVFRCETGYEHFFDLYRTMKPFKEEVISRSNGGVRQTLGYKDFALIKLVYPPMSAIKEFNTIYSHLLLGMKQCGKENKSLAKQRDELLPKLMVGDICLRDLTY